MTCLAAFAVVALWSPLTPGTPRRKDVHRRADDKQTVVTFDGDTIDGDLLRPDGDLMSGRPDLPMPSLVVPPKSFTEAEKETILSAADALARHRAHRMSTVNR